MPRVMAGNDQKRLFCQLGNTLGRASWGVRGLRTQLLLPETGAGNQIRPPALVAVRTTVLDLSTSVRIHGPPLKIYLIVVPLFQPSSAPLDMLYIPSRRLLSCIYVYLYVSYVRTPIKSGDCA